MGEIKNVREKHLSKKKKIIRKQKQIFESFIIQEKQLLIFLINILQEHLKQGVKQKMRRN